MHKLTLLYEINSTGVTFQHTAVTLDSKLVGIRAKSERVIRCYLSYYFYSENSYMLGVVQIITSFVSWIGNSNEGSQYQLNLEKYTLFHNYYQILVNSVLQITRGTRDNFGLIIHILFFVNTFKTSRRDGSNERSQHTFLLRNKTKIS